nr:uncharacterized protein LOC109162453 [Ipomoea batatas]
MLLGRQQRTFLMLSAEECIAAATDPQCSCSRESVQENRKQITKESWRMPTQSTNAALGSLGLGGSYDAWNLRNAKGAFCLAGAYSVDNMADINEIREVMIQDIWAWCRRKRRDMVVFESDEPGFEAMIQMRPAAWRKCSEHVNCLAAFFANKFEKRSLCGLMMGVLLHTPLRLLQFDDVLHIDVFLQEQRLEWIGLSCCSLLLSQGELKVGWNILAVNCGWDGCHEAEDG